MLWCCTLYCMMFNSISSLYTLDANSIQVLTNQKYLQTLPNVPEEGMGSKLPPLRNTIIKIVFSGFNYRENLPFLQNEASVADREGFQKLAKEGSWVIISIQSETRRERQSSGRSQIRGDRCLLLESS